MVKTKNDGDKKNGEDEKNHEAKIIMDKKMLKTKKITWSKRKKNRPIEMTMSLDFNPIHNPWTKMKYINEKMIPTNISNLGFFV